MKNLSFFSTLVVAVILFLGANMLAKYVFHASAIDFTEDELYTLSDETRAVLKNIDEPLDVRFFFSEELSNGLPIFQSYATRIRGLLEQYALLSGGKINVTYLDPRSFTEEEDLAVAHGLEGIPMDAAGNKFYFGMSVENSTDDRGVMPFFDPARDTFLEYDMIRLVNEIAHPRKKKVGLMSTLPMRGGSGVGIAQIMGPWVIYEQMNAAFDLKVLPIGTVEIPEDLDVLVLVHPFGFQDDTVYAIEQYMMAGGKAIFFLDSYMSYPDTKIKSSRMDKLLSSWGIGLAADRLAASKRAAIDVYEGDDNSRLTSYPNVTWLQMDASYLAADSVVTASLNKIRMLDSGYFLRDGDADVKFTPLITTKADSATIDVADIRDDKRDLLGLHRNYAPEGKELVLATQVKGIVQSAYNGHQITETNKDHIKISAEPIHAILVGDADMLRDEFWIEQENFFNSLMAKPSADNGAFVMNMVEFMGGDVGLINLRTRGTEDRRFTVLDELKRKAELAFRDEEERLKERLTSMEARLRELQSQSQEGGQLFSEQQTKEIQSFRKAFLDTRKELRGVQRDLNRDIERLGSWIAMLNIAAVPFLFLILAFIIPARLRRHKAGAS